MIEIDNIYNEDCLDGMRRMSDGSVDCIITSPPYNVGLSYNEYDDSKEYSDYLAWMTDVFNSCYRVLTADGRMCINIGDGKNGSIPTHSDFIQICKRIGFKVMTIIVWNKNTTSRRTAWGSFMSASAPSFPRNFEYILVFSKSKKLLSKGESTISKDDFIKWSNGMWTFNTEKLSHVGHPAAFPIELPTRLLRMLTYKDAVVLDMFIGSGTTAIACIKEKRQYIGFEISQEYVDIANKRITAETSQLSLF
jgi:site-specific DNA-methyltransferase (adenine-specific)